MQLRPAKWRSDRRTARRQFEASSSVETGRRRLARRRSADEAAWRRRPTGADDGFGRCGDWDARVLLESQCAGGCARTADGWGTAREGAASLRLVAVGPRKTAARGVRGGCGGGGGGGGRNAGRRKSHAAGAEAQLDATRRGAVQLQLPSSVRPRLALARCRVPGPSPAATASPVVVVHVAAAANVRLRPVASGSLCSSRLTPFAGAAISARHRSRIRRYALLGNLRGPLTSTPPPPPRHFDRLNRIASCFGVRTFFGRRKGTATYGGNGPRTSGERARLVGRACRCRSAR